ncbi:MAG: 3'-5' exonuclease domain-containing protein 2 [Bacteroidales bacterium]|nr:3'-5' exonuclease domain-containing protein 2 [Bacteroidales bacterium]MBD5211628.1 3'-5' exonuclease domain-containing protein 2 [Bacteroidales bacterium]MBD5216982.1 3'-5' exonuclease domain-containing protein 2 [Bacteroidales bacterium]
MKTDDCRRNFTISIPKETLNSLPAAEYQGEIHVIDQPEQVENAILRLRSSDVVGFDTETRPSFKKGQTHQVSLIQLATRSECFLFRLNHLGLPTPLLDYIEDEHQLKIGLSIHDDFHNLQRLHPGLSPAGFIDLQDFVKKWKITDTSLTKIHAILFGKRISKSQRLTNWEAETLSPHQQSYASLDALACINIYDYLHNGEFSPAKSNFKNFPENNTP